MKKINYHLAIVGFGARGLFALELFYSSLSRKQNPSYSKTIIFESSDSLGTGKAWDPEQPEANLINIADRALDCFQGRPEFTIKDVRFPAFPAYLDWMEQVMGQTVDDQKDTFVPRKVMGAYLSHRAKSIIEPLQSLGLLSIVRERITGIEKTADFFELEAATKEKYQVQQVILAVGHLSTNTSDQNKEFIEHAKKTDTAFIPDPYSGDAAETFKNTTRAAIKGLGLSMIDVVGMIVQHDKGEFNEDPTNTPFLKYSNDDSDLTIVPFSLDGLPIVPKPIGKQIDDLFSLGAEEKNELLKQLANKVHQDHIQEVEDFLRPIASYVVKVYNQLTDRYYDKDLAAAEGQQLIIDWLLDPSISSNYMLDQSLAPVEYMKRCCQMSYGLTGFSLDYVIGQVLRQLQPDLYNILSYSTLSPEVMAAFIKVDEQVKRYSFGPPVESVLQLIALEQAGILDLRFVNDPEIELVDQGFKLSKGSNHIICDSMTDAVLSSPDAKEIDDVLIRTIINKPLAQQFHEELGVAVARDHTILLGSVKVDGLYLMDRNAKGSVYGVDAVLECFNEFKMTPMIASIVKAVDHQ